MASCSCGRGWHVILTPDHDLYAEQISLENDEIQAFRLGQGEQLPAGLTEANTYRFRRMPDEPMMHQLRRDAAHAAAAMTVALGAVAGAPAPAAAPMVAAAAAFAPGGDDEVWVRVESEGQKIRGEIVTITGNKILHGNIGLKPDGAQHFAIRRVKRTEIGEYAGREAAADARLLGITFQGTARSDRQWRDLSREVRQEDFSDWVVPGPRTASWCVQYINRKNGGPTDHHKWWSQAHGLKPDSWGMAEHDNLSKVLDRLGRYDGLDLTNLSGAELIFRRLQLIEYVYSERGPGGGKGSSKGDKKKDDPANLTYEATIFGGAHKEYGDCMVAPSLLEYVAKEVESEAAVMKSVRKAREERAAAAKWTWSSTLALQWRGPLGHQLPRIAVLILLAKMVGIGAFSLSPCPLVQLNRLKVVDAVDLFYVGYKLVNTLTSGCGTLFGL